MQHPLNGSPITASPGTSVTWSYVLSVNAGYYAVTPLSNSTITNNPSTITSNSNQTSASTITGQVALLNLITTSVRESSENAACNNNTVATSMWITGSDQTPTVGEYMYATNTRTVAQTGAYKSNSPNNNYSIIIGSQGLITNYEECPEE